LTGVDAGPILHRMGRKTGVGAVLAFLGALIAAGYLRYCGRRPIVAQAFPLNGLVLTSSTKKIVPRGRAGHKKSGLTAPRLLNLGELQANIRKYYPEAEHSVGKEGRVVMGMVVEVDGSVDNVRVVTSGGADFDAAARKVVRAMRFSPARMAGAPAAVEISESVDFEFDGK